MGTPIRSIGSTVSLAFIGVFIFFQLLVPVASLIDIPTPVMLHLLPGFLVPLAALALAIARFGPIGLATLPIGFGIGLGFEVLSISTGFPFGNYTYTERFGGPWILDLVPLAIPIYWYAITLASYLVAESIVGGVGTPKPVARSILRIFLAGTLTLSWDLVVEPLMVSIGLWIWLDEGIYYGAPLTNFLGWLLVGLTIATLYELLNRLRHTSDIGREQPARTPAVMALAIYLTLVVSTSLSNFSRGIDLPGYLGLAISAIVLLSWIRLYMYR